MDNLIKVFAPIVYFHKNETYFPSSIEFILENSELIDTTIPLNGSVIIPKGLLNSESLYEYSNTHYPNTTGLTTLYINYVNIINSGEDYTENVPVYATIRETNETVCISYSFIYPFNGPKLVLGCFPTGQHYGDVEHITVELTKNTNQLKRVYYGAHTGTEGRWVDAKDVPMENGKIVVYSAEDSHACYPQTGSAVRFGGFGNDNMSEGKRWEPSVIRLYRKEDPEFDPKRDGWIYFAGRIGNDGVTSISDKDYFTIGDSEVNNPPRITTSGC